MEITMLKYFCKSENRTEIEHLKKKKNAIKEKLFSFVFLNLLHTYKIIVGIGTNSNTVIMRKFDY